MAKFTTQRKKFCDGVLSGLNGEAAAKAAGFSEATADSKASHLMKDPDVAKYIEDGEFKALQKAEITAEWILRETLDVAMLAKDSGDFKGALKGLEMLGKNKKLWVDVQEHKFNITEMGRVMIRDERGNAMAMEFNVGQEPNEIEDKR